MSDRDYYEVLGLTPRADGAMVDQAYWHLARKYQALATTNERGRRLLDELNEAYGVLGNARLRKEYDAFRDDVLVGQGVIAGRAGARAQRRPRRKKAAAPPAEATATSPRKLPASLGIWFLAGTLAAGSVAAAIVLGQLQAGVIGVAVAVVVGVAPVLKRRVAALSLSMPSVSLPSVNMPDVSMPAMPSLPQVAMPEVRTPKLNLAGVGERLGRSAERDAGIDPEELRASTSAVIARWRKSMGLKPSSLRDLSGPAAPSNELVEIVESERQIDESPSEPLMAVIDILRGAHKSERTSVSDSDD